MNLSIDQAGHDGRNSTRSRNVLRTKSAAGQDVVTVDGQPVLATIGAKCC